MSKSYRTTPSNLLGIVDPVKAFIFNRGIWYFGTSLDAEMDTASDKANTPETRAAARYSVLMSRLYPDQPEKRYRNPGVSSKSKAEPAMGGESYFAKNQGSRRRT